MKVHLETVGAVLSMAVSSCFSHEESKTGKKNPIIKHLNKGILFMLSIKVKAAIVIIINVLQF
jgi:hypothetical protein